MRDKKINRSCIDGFTLVEILIVFAFLAIGVAATFSILDNQYLGNLESDSQIIAVRLKEAQARAAAGVNGASWGIRFDNVAAPFYALFQGLAYVAPSSTYYLSSVVEFQAPAVATSVDVIFSKLFGTTATTTSIVIRLKTNPAELKTIKVEPSGRVSVE